MCDAKEGARALEDDWRRGRLIVRMLGELWRRLVRDVDELELGRVTPLQLACATCCCPSRRLLAHRDEPLLLRSHLGVTQLDGCQVARLEYAMGLGPGLCRGLLMRLIDDIVVVAACLDGGAFR